MFEGEESSDKGNTGSVLSHNIAKMRQVKPRKPIRMAHGSVASIILVND